MAKDRVTGIIAVMLGIVVVILTSRLPNSNMANDIGPRAFPYITSGILILTGVTIFFKKPSGEAKPFFKHGALSVKRFIAIWVVLILYVAAMNFFGFPIPTVAVLMTMCLMFGKDPEHGVNIKPVQAVIYSVIVTVVLYVVFTVVLHLRLPIGQLGVKIAGIHLL